MRPGKRFFVLALSTLAFVVLCLPASRLADTAKTAVARYPRAARPLARSVGRTHRYPGYGYPGYGLAPIGYPGGYVVLYPYGPPARGYLAPFPPGPYSYHGYSAYAFQLYGHPPGVWPPTPPNGPQLAEPPMPEPPMPEPPMPEPPTTAQPEPEPIPPPLPDEEN